MNKTLISQEISQGIKHWYLIILKSSCTAKETTNTQEKTHKMGEKTPELLQLSPDFRAVHPDAHPMRTLVPFDSKSKMTSLKDQQVVN